MHQPSAIFDEFVCGEINERPELRIPLRLPVFEHFLKQVISSANKKYT